MSPRQGATVTNPFVQCDADVLRRVIVHRPGAEIRKTLALSGSESSFFGVDLFEDDLLEQHDQFVKLLERDDVEVIQLVDLLDEAIERAKAENALFPWLEKHAPHLAHHHQSIRSSSLIGADDDVIYGKPENGGKFRSLSEPLKFLFFVRDLAVVTPRGVVLSNFINRYREFETAIIAFVFRWSRTLEPFPVVFDACAERVYLQGGDAIVADSRTLLLGVNNLTQVEAAPRLAKALGMDVVAVDLLGHGTPPGRGRDPNPWTPLRTKFLHLDTILNLIDTDSVLATPYFLESEHAGTDPLSEILQAMADRPDSHQEYLRRAIYSLRRIGSIRLFRANTGVEDRGVLGLKLLDYLRGRGYRVCFVGGDPPINSRVKHFVEVIHRELRFQAANVLATGPGRLISAAGNPETLLALKSAGVRVSRFPADDLVRWHGGPHCLSLPLSRTSER